MPDMQTWSLEHQESSSQLTPSGVRPHPDRPIRRTRPEASNQLDRDMIPTTPDTEPSASEWR
jgi:hypothetical protein